MVGINTGAKKWDEKLHHIMERIPRAHFLFLPYYCARAQKSSDCHNTLHGGLLQKLIYGKEVGISFPQACGKT